MIGPVRQSLAVARKDIRAELRSRYALNTGGMFVLVVAAIVLFASGTESLTPAVGAILLMISLFFLSVTIGGRSILVEQERGTDLLLRLSIPSVPVYFGKLCFNLMLCTIAGILVYLLLALLLAETYGVGSGVMVLLVLLVSGGFGAAMTIVSAILAPSSGKSMLSAVLAFPVVLPVLYLGTDLFRRGLEDRPLGTMTSELALIGAYFIAVIAVSYILFDILWKE